MSQEFFNFMLKKNIKILIVFILLCIIGFFYYLRPKDNELDLIKEINSNIEDKVSLNEQNLKVSLVILNKKYETEVEDGMTVLEVMKKVKKESSNDNIFDFKYGEFAGLGVFIDEINGKKSGNGGYWIYSVNGVEANVGVSNYKIKNNDVISWKYEK